MKRWPFVALAALIFTLPMLGQAQGGDAAGRVGAWRRDLKQLALTSAEMGSIKTLLDGQTDLLAKAQSEMKIIQAKLERLLLDRDPDMGAAKDLVKSSLDWELQIRMARIERAVALRKLLGPERWALLQRVQRDYLAAKRAGKIKPGDLGDNGDALAELLDRLE